MTIRYASPGISCIDHTIEVPLDHDQPNGEKISIFAREVVAAGSEQADLPWLLFLQGGPGGKATRPAPMTGWLRRALREFRVLLLDQRGTGRSTPANRQSLARFDSGEQAADYLRHFRSDSIVRDAEAFRRQLIGDRPWSVLGQSFGGFCTLTYLSLAPASLTAAFVTGGLSGLDAGPDEVYRALYPRVLRKNAEYFARYPGDESIVRDIVAHLDEHEVTLPTGERLTPRRLQTLGIEFGKTSTFDRLHYLLEEAFIDTALGRDISDTFRHGVGASVSFATDPLYAVLHESIYCQGTASAWSAHRVRDEFDAFALDGASPVRFTGEMIYPWMFDEDPALRPLQDAAEALAAKTDWPALYDHAVLNRNTVPVAAAVYHDDMYVDRELSLRTADEVRGARVWVTNQYEHDGLRMDPDVLDRLIAMTRNEI
ncbi:alpha/beta fold hydrolase [Actinoalloteichus hymeniacidonis]|uniref:Alpha/beta hydrolase family protein n=1 Tax=Actinoalloteichus hymeniacidonis TaxID=340345 RepID=A0AAC9HLC8_9PSEU|nr:alpha/beta fold hydrolase [Actinoalloteichus hymeniacidonis]AOS61527.1 alpha/beta hydrolase family protein [Actinoalloteichus hymeniacidonis]MBB5910465.1 pimeloyl-ACP methyl ester carboxylesterase [Actinoalloteichus hymeniacidonis]